jgi:RNA polymerase sigma-70 factor, ECF subfamily
VTNEVGRRIVELLPRLRRFALALSGDPDKGDDLVQEGCARAFAHLDKWRPGTRLDSWMYKIIHNLWLDQKRASKVRGVAIDLDSAPQLGGEDGRDVVNGRLTLRRVLDGLASLPEEQQALITLISIEGLSYEDAAAILGIPVGTATSRLVRGRRALYAIAIEGANGPEGKNDKAD